jgi:hypothetical protein
LEDEESQTTTESDSGEDEPERAATKVSRYDECEFFPTLIRRFPTVPVSNPGSLEGNGSVVSSSGVVAVAHVVTKLLQGAID